MRQRFKGKNMSLQPLNRPRPKSVIEHGACFGLALGGLIAVTFAIQWLLNAAP